MTQASPASLLEGVRVLDMTNVLAGPFAAYQLALFGADVVKVEVPGAGDLARRLGASPELNARDLGVSFLAQNAQKRSLTVNLKDERGGEVLRRAIAEADVLIENFRPGVLERLGFGWDALREINPRLVYCAISGFGQTGPTRSSPAYDQIIQGSSGMMSVTGTAETGPLRAGFPIADTLGGMAAAFAISSALVARDRTGRGSMLDVSMLETAVTALGWVVSNLLVADTEPQARGNDNMTASPSGAFATADGVLNIAANKQEQFERLCEIVGRPELVADERFAQRDARIAHRVELARALEDALAAHPASYWQPLLDRAGVPAATVLGVREVLASPQIEARRLVHDLPFPGSPDARLQVLGHGIHVDGEPSGPVVPPPTLGQHTDEILAELGFDADDIRDLHERGAV